MDSQITPLRPNGGSALERIIVLLPRGHQVRERVESLYAEFERLDTQVHARGVVAGQAMKNRADAKTDTAALARDDGSGRAHADNAAIAAQKVIEKRANDEVNASLDNQKTAIAWRGQVATLFNRIPLVIRPYLIPANTTHDKDGNIIRVDTLKEIKLAAPAKLPTGLSVEDASELGDQYRTEVGVLKVEREEIRDAVPDFEFAKRALLRDLDAKSESAELRIQKVGPFKGRLLWPKTSVNAEPLSSGYKPRITDVDALLIRHLRPQMEKEALAALKAYYDQVPKAFTAEEKRRALKDINAKIARAEGLEVAAIWKARELGADVRFRPDTTITTLLGIAA